MTYAESFRELEVYKLSRQLSQEIFEITKQFPKEEIYNRQLITDYRLFVIPS